MEADTNTEGDLVEITAEEAARLAMVHGTIMILHRDGRMYRVLDPWERDDTAKS